MGVSAMTKSTHVNGAFSKEEGASLGLGSTEGAAAVGMGYDADMRDIQGKRKGREKRGRRTRGTLLRWQRVWFAEATVAIHHFTRSCARFAGLPDPGGWHFGIL